MILTLEKTVDSVIAVASSIGAKVPSEASLRQYLSDATRHVVVSFRDGEPVAYCAWRETADALVVHGVFVHADHQSQGHGSRLLSLIELKARHRPIVVSIAHDAKYLSGAIEWLAGRGYRLDTSTLGAKRVELKRWRSEATANRIQEYLLPHGCTGADFRAMTDIEILEFAERINPDTGELIICAGRLSGAQSCRVFRASHGFAVVVGDELRQIYVHPRNRRQGHGLRLLRDVVAATGTTLYLTCEARYRAFFGRARFRLAYGRRGERERKQMIRIFQ